MRKYLKDIGADVFNGCVPGGGDVSILTDGRKDRFIEQIDKYGFDERETWNLNYTSACWMYEHLMMYKELGGQIVDLSYYKFNVHVAELNKELTNELFEELKNSEFETGICDDIEKQLTQEQCIDTIIDYLKYFILSDEVNYDESVEVSNLKEIVAVEKLRAAFRIYAEIAPAMWW